MEFFAIVLVLWGLSFAVVRATEAAWNGIRNEYRRRVDAVRARFGNSTNGVGVGTRVGSGLAAVCIGLPMWLARFARGWGSGWREGRTRARQRYGRPDDEPSTESKTDEQTEPDAPQQTPVPANGDPQTPPEPTTPAEAIPVQGGNPVAVQTTTGGEVTSVETALAELQAIRAEAAASLEDAQADARRSDEDAQRIDLFVASLSNLKFGAPIVAGAHAMKDTAAQAATAARMRASAADQRLGQVGSLVAIMQQHLTIQDVGATVGGVAERQAYTG